jgi:hypothetical protein
MPECVSIKCVGRWSDRLLIRRQQQVGTNLEEHGTSTNNTRIEHSHQERIGPRLRMLVVTQPHLVFADVRSIAIVALIQDEQVFGNARNRMAHCDGRVRSTTTVPKNPNAKRQLGRWYHASRDDR